MISAITKIASYIFRSRSPVAAFRKILNRDQYRVLQFSLPDRREVYEVASRISGIGREELVSRVAVIMEMPPLLRIQSDKGTCNALNYPKESFSAAAACPIIRNNILIGIACVDPVLLRKILPRCASFPMFLSSWSSIKAALDVLFEEQQTGAPQSENYDVLAVHGVIDTIMKEASQFDVSSVVLHLEGAPYYLISLPDGRKAKGDIHKDIKGQLACVLKTQPVITLSEGSIQVQGTSDSNEFLLSKAVAKGEVIPFPEQKVEISEKPQAQTTGKILLVDDNQTFAKVLDKFLSKLGVTTDHAPNGQRAIELLESESDTPALIVCDIHMPIMNGFEFVRRIKEIERLSRIPVIMLTSDSDVEAELSLLSFGVEAFIGKQEDPRILCMHAKRILESQRTKAAA